MDSLGALVNTRLPESPHRSLHRPGQGDLTAVNKRRRGPGRFRRCVTIVLLTIAFVLGWLWLAFWVAVASALDWLMDDGAPQEATPLREPYTPAVRLIVWPAEKDIPR